MNAEYNDPDAIRAEIHKIYADEQVSLEKAARLHALRRRLVELSPQGRQAERWAKIARCDLILGDIPPTPEPEEIESHPGEDHPLWRAREEMGWGNFE